MRTAGGGLLQLDEFVGRAEEPPPGSDLAAALAGYVAVTVFDGLAVGDATEAASALAQARSKR